MNQERLEASLEGIRQLLSHLHGEVTTLEASYNQVLLVLRKMEAAIGTDELTQLPNRKAFFTKWDALLEQCQSLNTSSGLMIIDIDHFKKINDTYGHPTGDAVLRSVGALLKRFEMPGEVLVSRYGGEEFAVAARGTDAELNGIAELIRRGAERLEGPVIGPDGKPNEAVRWKCTLSVGVAGTAKEGCDPKKLLSAADEALYRAKRSGRNRVNAA